MALKDDKSVRQRFTEFVKKYKDKHGVIESFHKIKEDLLIRYPELFIDEITTKRTRDSYYSAVRSVKKEITNDNIVTKTKNDVLSPSVQTQIQEDTYKNPEKYMSNANSSRTIVLKLKNNDKVFFKMSDEVVNNLTEAFKYWYAHNEVEMYRSGAIRRRFSAEMVEEYYRIFKEVQESKKTNNKKLKVYKELEKGML